jgi:hypothetical protein
MQQQTESDNGSEQNKKSFYVTQAPFTNPASKRAGCVFSNAAAVFVRQIAQIQTPQTNAKREY